MILGQRQFTAGDKRQITVSYDAFLPLGGSLVTAAVTTPDMSVTISGVALVAFARKVQFYAAGGTVNTTFTVSVQITDNIGQVVTDTIDFPVTAP